MRQNRFATHQITYPIWLSPFPFLRPLHKAHTSRFYTQKDTIARGSKQFSFYLSSRWALHSKLVCSKDFYRISTLQHAFEIFQYLKKGSNGKEENSQRSVAFGLSLRLEFVEIHEIGIIDTLRVVRLLRNLRYGNISLVMTSNCNCQFITYLLWWWVWVNRGKQKHKTIYAGVAALRLALVERGQSLRRVKCFPVIREVREECC